MVLMLSTPVSGRVFSLMSGNWLGSPLSSNQVLKVRLTTIGLSRSSLCYQDHMQLNLTIFLDLKKTFNAVVHKTLIEKLRKYGTRELSGDWFQSKLETEGSTVPPMVMSVLLRQLHVVFLRTPVLAPFPS